MRTIGIITTSNAINYGAVLQAYALRTVLSIINQKNVEIVNYGGDLATTGRKYYRNNTNLKNLLFNMFLFLNFNYKLRRKKLIQKFDEFKKNELKITKPLLLTKQEVESAICYDILICGSDQIWNLNLFQDDVFFLRFNKPFANIKFYSYAASIAENMTEEQEHFIVSNIKHFSLVSVREKVAAKRLESISERTIIPALDPVYLLDKAQWENISKNINMRVHENYVLIFFIGHAKNDQTIINGICKNKDYKIVILNLHPIKYIKGDLYIEDASPFEFVALIKNASMVITDSFHATSFSIIFNKEFFTIKRGKRNSRTENLFNMFQTGNRYVTNGEPSELSQICYEIVNKNIERERNLSLKYLRNIVEARHDQY